VTRVGDAQARVSAIQDTQDYAKPFVVLSSQLANENAMFTKVIDRAREVVDEKTIELARTKEALSNSIELLQDQITENNLCVDEIRDLEDQIKELNKVVSRLLEKLPDAGREDPCDTVFNKETN
jgi:thiamine kinase-like enzyme